MANQPSEPVKKPPPAAADKNPKQRRRFHHKSKTGCLTCKYRRVRCDEQKPFCHRCVSTGRNCDGYALDQSSGSSGSGSSQSRTQASPFVITTSTGYDYDGVLSLRQRQGKPAQQGYTIKIDRDYGYASTPTMVQQGEYYFYPVTPIEVPRNFSYSIADKLVSILEIKDPRYSLACYGDFLRYIPQYLGRNEALDDAVEALVCAHQYHYMREIPEGAVVKYISTLKSLRSVMARSEKVSTIETWAAVYIAMICQGWIGRSDDNIKSHGVILSHLAASAQAHTFQNDTLQLEFLQSLYMPLVMEASINPSISMEPWRKLLKGRKTSNIDASSRTVQYPSVEALKLTRYPAYFYHPDKHVEDIDVAYNELCADQNKVAMDIVELEQELSRSPDLDDPKNYKRLKKLNATQAVYASLLVFAIAFNSLIRTTDPTRKYLLAQAIQLTDEFIKLARRVSQYRPLGSSYITPMLCAVWATTFGLTEQQEQIYELILTYQDDFPTQIAWEEEARWLRDSHAISKSMLDPESGEPSDGTSVGRPLNITMTHCLGAAGSLLFS